MAFILVIDDDHTLREVVRMALETAGHHVIEAADGSAGIELARTRLPDLVLCDVRMEKLDGYRTLATLREDPATALLPFILMTGQADNAGMRQGMESGADDYLAKPFSVDRLLAAVDARLRKHQTVRAQAQRDLADLRASISLALPHELLTPLNGIFGFADILISDAANLQTHEVVSMAEAIHDSGKRLHRLIENFLIFAQIQLVSEEQVKELRAGRTLDAHELIRGLAEDRAARSHRPADLSLALEPVMPAITPDYLTRIVDELLDNAFKFSAAGSPIRIVLKPHDGRCFLRISDKGRGLKPDQIAQIGAYMQFDRRFYEQQGSGLGLTVSWRLTELHGGTFKITSEPGLGTAVEVTLPAATAGS